MTLEDETRLGMKQRIPPHWFDERRPGRSPHLLVETDDPVLEISDFTLFHEAGFLVAQCSGPGADRLLCPLLRQERCHVMDGADVALHTFAPGTGIVEAIRALHPEVAVCTVGWYRDRSPHRSEAGDFDVDKLDTVAGQIRGLCTALESRALV